MEHAQLRAIRMCDRLTRMIERLTAQRACLDHAATLVAQTPGHVLEVGLGKGRTYDRLRTLFSDREVFAFDRSVHCPPDVRPDDAHLFVGELRLTLTEAYARFGSSAVLVHADIGTDDRAKDAALVADLAPLIDRLLRREGLVLTDRQMTREAWVALALPADAGPWPYFIYRKS